MNKLGGGGRKEGCEVAIAVVVEVVVVEGEAARGRWSIFGEGRIDGYRYRKAGGWLWLLGLGSCLLATSLDRVELWSGAKQQLSVARTQVCWGLGLFPSLLGYPFSLTGSHTPPSSFN